MDNNNRGRRVLMRIHGFAADHNFYKK